MPFLIACSSCCLVSNVIFTVCSGLLSFDLSRYIDAMLLYDFPISVSRWSSDKSVGTTLRTAVLWLGFIGFLTEVPPRRVDSHFVIILSMRLASAS